MDIRDGFNWMDWASCFGVAHQYPLGDDPFFKQGRGFNYREARSFCASCPVAIDCLIAALDDEHEGFQGGMSKNERNETRKMLEIGVKFKYAVESIWAKHRKKKYPAAPPASIWKDWNV